jgi:glutaredoxin 3
MAESAAKPEIVLYAQALCGYCSAAKKLLRGKGVDFELIDVTLDPAGRREAKQRSGRSTLPQIFIDGQPVGGYDDIAALDRDGRLDAMLGIAGHNEEHPGE